jgi:hypothetical protein
MGATMHDLKVWTEFFDAILDGRKTFEVRNARDRCFAVGDVLRLREWTPAIGEAVARASVSQVEDGPGRAQAFLDRHRVRPRAGIPGHLSKSSAQCHGLPCQEPLADTVCSTGATRDEA